VKSTEIAEVRICVPCGVIEVVSIDGMCPNCHKPTQRTTHSHIGITPLTLEQQITLNNQRTKPQK